MQNKIESYLNGEMSVNEKSDFEQKLQTAPEVQKEVAEMRVLIGALRRKKSMQAILVAEKLNFRKKILKISLFCLLLGIAGFSVWSYFSNEKTPELPIPTKTEQPILPPPTESKSPEKSDLPKSPPQNQPKINREIAQAPVPKSPDAPIYRSLPAAEAMPADAIALADQFLPSFSPKSYLNMAGLTENWDAGKFDAYYNGVENLIVKNGRTTPGAELARAACLLRLHRPVVASQILFPLLDAAEPIKSDAAWLLALSFVMQGKDDSARVALAAIRGKYVDSAKLLLAEMGE